MLRSNLHIYQSPILHESRIFKITKSLAEASVFEKIVVVGKWKENLPHDQELDSIRSIRRLPTWIPARASGPIAKLAGTAEWMARVYAEGVRLKPDCVNCHSLVVLPVGVALKKRLGCRLI
ncbi:MAG: glycoside hydrolase, partial [Planctomycetes bacterium]|nr:glycoside hydrolase [Planctomycetota bacterium]